MEFYIGENLTPVSVEIQPNLTKAKDTTNDSFKCVLKANSDPLPIKPMTPFKVVYDDNTTQVFWVIADTVVIFSLNPETYKHSLTLVQYRYFLNKHILRNTVLNQPRNQKSKLFTSGCCAYWGVSNSYSMCSQVTDNKLDIWYETLNISSPSKIRECVVKLDLYALVQTSSNDGYFSKMSINELHNLDANFSTNFSIRIKDGNTVVSTIDNFDLNRSVSGKRSLSSVCDDINEYLTTHPSATLKAEYYMGNETQDITQTFVIKTQPKSFPLATTVIFNVTIELNTYNYTMYDVIDVLLKQYRLTDDSGSKREQLFYLPTSNSTGEDLELYKLLTTTYPPDTLSFTQATWYEVLTEIFRFYDAGFQFDENKVLKIEYYNNPNDERQKIFSSVSLSQSDKNYCEKRILDYQNANQTLNLNRIPTRANTLGVPQKGEYVVMLPKPIYEIDDISFIPNTPVDFVFPGNVTKSLTFDVPLTLTPFVFSQDIWTTLDKADVSQISGIDFLKNYQQTTLYFSRGDNLINVSTYYKQEYNIQFGVLKYVLQRAISRFFGCPTYDGNAGYIFDTFNNLATDWKNQRFNITYQVLNNGKLSIETITNKYDGEMLVNQNAGLIDINKMGSSMFVESLKDGEPTLTATYEIKQWQDKINEGDYFIDNSGNRWIATVINYSLLPNGNTKCSVEFTKNFNLLSLRVQSDKEKRLTAISHSLAVVSEDVYTDYVYVTDINELPNGENIALNSVVLATMIGQTFGRKNFSSFVDYASIFKSGDPNTRIGIYLPVFKYGAGNCVCFEMAYDDPINAGNQLLSNETGWWQGDSYFSQATPYTDNDAGWKETFTIDFCKDLGNDALINFPLVKQKESGNTLVETVGRITRLKYYKKPNEIFGLNYEWCFLPIESQINDFFIGNKFININAFTNEVNTHFYLRYTTSNSDFQYSIMDIKGEQEGGEPAELLMPLRFAISHSNNVVVLSIYDDNLDPDEEPTRSVKTWAIVDENNDIYFASNHPATFDLLGSVKLYFVTKKQRI